ncbi:MAG: XRE family transcriptional regulator [Gammaproteobacteria bacterium]|nr:XRE family transcriptional regulator [Gammaproteobacteria bacterium]
MKTQDVEETGHLERMLGETIRRARKKKNLSVQELSGIAEISVSMLSRIENGHTSASLSTLKSLSDALNISLANLFQNVRQSHESTFVKSGQGLTVQRHDNRIGHQYQLLGHTFHSDIKLEPYLITLTEKAEEFPLIFHEGIEFMYILEGEMIYQEGDRTYHMCPGDSLYFDPSSPHGPLELISVPVKMVTVISALN